jgi:hypothetical protein
LAEVDDEIQALLEDFRGVRVPAPEARMMAMPLAITAYQAYTRAERPEQGGQVLESILQIFMKTFPGEDAETAYLMMSLADLFTWTGEHASAEELLIEAIELMAGRMGHTHPQTESGKLALSRAYERHYRALAAEGQQPEARAVAASGAELNKKRLEAERALPPANYRVSQDQIQCALRVAYS